MVTYADLERVNRDDIRVNLQIANERIFSLTEVFASCWDILFQYPMGPIQPNLAVADFSLFIIGGFELVILFYGVC